MERSVVRASRLRATVAGTAILALTVCLSGCGSDTVGYSKGDGDRAHGKQLFTQSCGSCHTLSDAGTKGQIGPNLDYAFLQSRRDGLGQTTIQQVVRGQIAYSVAHPSTGSPGMPQNIVKGQDAEDVASYVASVAGIGDPTVSKPQPAPTPAPASTPAPGKPASGGAAAQVAAGKAVFASAGCISCHTLKDAGSTGTVGPNLDQAKPSKALAITRVTNGKAPMPSFKGQLSDAQIDAVATYVSTVAGK
jgi:mono/diheme cytochrome c family protein